MSTKGMALAALAGAVLASVPVAAEQAALSWVRVTEHAGWQARDSSGEVTLNGRMWLLGGWFDSRGPCPRDVWSSADGGEWVQATAKAPWTHSDLATTLVHDGRMWLMGGWADGRLPGASASNEVSSSTDGVDWQCATDKAPWRARCGAGGVVLNGRMWLLGGIERYYDGDMLLNDVWSSADGKTWECATEHAPWAPRAYHGALAYAGKLWVFGGGNYVPTYSAHNDVWCSTDGREWTQVTDHAPWPPRIWFSSVVYRDRMWLLGGWSNLPSKNWNDVWTSTDGKQWTPLLTKEVWSPRHEQSAYVHQDKLWLVAGNPWPTTNDVWRLDVPPGWFR